MTVHSSILAWEISWTEEPGGLQLMGSQRGEHNLAIKQQQQIYIYIHTHIYIFLTYIYIYILIYMYIYAVTIDIYILIHIFFFRLFSILSYYKILNIILCAMQ